MVRDRMASRLAIAAVLGLVVAALSACGSDDDDGEPNAEGPASLTVAFPGATTDNAVPWVAQELGYFDDEGVDVELQVPGAANVLTSLLSGQSDLAGYAVGSGLAPVSEGKDVVVVAYNSGRRAGYVWGAEGINAITDCTRVASNPIGSSTYNWNVVYRDLLDLDYQIVELNDPAAIRSAFAGGQVDCSVGSYGIMGALLALNEAHLILDARDPSALPAGAPQGVVEGAYFGLREELEARSDAVVRYFKACQRALGYIQGSEPAEVAELLKGNSDFSAFEVDAMAAEIEFIRDTYTLPNGTSEISAGDWASTLEFLALGGADVDPGDSELAFDSRVDMSYYRDAVG